MSKVVLITGGSSGIGKSIGEYLHHKGFVVYGTSRNPEKVLNSVFPLIALDVRDTDSIVKAVAKVIAISGRLDVVINNAELALLVLWKRFRRQKSRIILRLTFLDLLK